MNTGGGEVKIHVGSRRTGPILGAQGLLPVGKGKGEQAGGKAGGSPSRAPSVSKDLGRRGKSWQKEEGGTLWYKSVPFCSFLFEFLIRQINSSEHSHITLVIFREDDICGQLQKSR